MAAQTLPTETTVRHEFDEEIASVRARRVNTYGAIVLAERDVAADAAEAGAIVAREYGIPAVICVPDATDRVRTGQRITLDGTTGTITLDEP